MPKTPTRPSDSAARCYDDALVLAGVSCIAAGVARQSGWEDSDNQDEKPSVAAHA